jgi:hypothetical protein
MLEVPGTYLCTTSNFSMAYKFKSQGTRPGNTCCAAGSEMWRLRVQKLWLHNIDESPWLVVRSIKYKQMTDMIVARRYFAANLTLLPTPWRRRFSGCLKTAPQYPSNPERFSFSIPPLCNVVPWFYPAWGRSISVDRR